MLRALEVILLTGRVVPTFEQKWSRLIIDVIRIMPNQCIYEAKFPECILAKCETKPFLMSLKKH